MAAVALAEVDWILDIQNPFLIPYSAVSDRGYNDLALSRPDLKLSLFLVALPRPRPLLQSTNFTPR